VWELFKASETQRPFRSAQSEVEKEREEMCFMLGPLGIDGSEGSGSVKCAKANKIKFTCSRRSPEEAYISTVVAELLQQLAPAVVAIPNEAGVGGDWFIPQWIFEIRQEVRETKRTLS
jgi:hypothetical protein